MSNDNIQFWFEEGQKKFACQDYEAALMLYGKAIELVPEPFIDQEISAGILTAIGDVYFMTGNYEKAQKVFADVMLCSGAPANEYIRLRRGQIAFELSDFKKAKIELACAYMNGGKEVFQNEDRKYLEFIEPILKETTHH